MRSERERPVCPKEKRTPKDKPGGWTAFSKDFVKSLADGRVKKLNLRPYEGTKSEALPNRLPGKSARS